MRQSCNAADLGSDRPRLPSDALPKVLVGALLVCFGTRILKNGKERDEVLQFSLKLCVWLKPLVTAIFSPLSYEMGNACSAPAIAQHEVACYSVLYSFLSSCFQLLITLIVERTHAVH